MTPREVVRVALTGHPPPYVPWSFGFTQEAHARLVGHFGRPDLDPFLQPHLLTLGNGLGFFTDVGDDCVRDHFGVTWDRSADRDIGIVKGLVLPEPTLRGYPLPDPLAPRCFEGMAEALDRHGDRYRVFAIGFSLFERAWTLRGMENLMIDFYENPGFVRELLRSIADYNIAQVRRATEFDIDAVYFGDDWGSQRGLIMGPDFWREFIRPELCRMYDAVHAAGRKVFIHSCGKVDELFDDLAEIGVNCFNPFQPEVMDVWSLLPRFRGRLAFHGGLSTQRVLPYGTPDDVRRVTRRLLELGRAGGYIFAPAHAVEGDVPLANLLAFIDEVTGQPKSAKAGA